MNLCRLRTGRADGPVRSGAGHFPVDGSAAAKVFTDHAPAASSQRRIHPAAPGHLSEPRHERKGLHREIPRLLARHAGTARLLVNFIFIHFSLEKKCVVHFYSNLNDRLSRD